MKNPIRRRIQFYFVILTLIAVLNSCEQKKEIFEADLIGMWVEQENNDSQKLNGIEIEKWDSGLYLDYMSIINKNGETWFETETGGCFIEIIKTTNQKQKLNYTCLFREYENSVSLKGGKLIIGTTQYRKYENDLSNN